MKNAKNIQMMQDHLILKGYSKSTQKTYMMCIKDFLSSFDKDGKRITTQDAIDYIKGRIINDKISLTYQKHITASIRMYFEACLARKPKTFRLPNPRRKNKMPNILEPEEVQSILKQINNLKHKAIVATMYSAGLRVSEVCKLKVSDIDSKGMYITIHEPKWNKDRKVMLDKSVLNLLREYYYAYRPTDLLFEGRNELYSVTSVRSVIKKAAKQAGIAKNISTHTFRHSCFTTLLKTGTDILTIKELAGHKYLSTTEKYLHILSEDVLKTKSPISNIKI